MLADPKNDSGTAELAHDQLISISTPSRQKAVSAIKRVRVEPITESQQQRTILIPDPGRLASIAVALRRYPGRPQVHPSLDTSCQPLTIFLRN